MKTYSFLTQNNFRMDVIATTPKRAYKNILSIVSNKGEVLPAFIEYDKDGISDYNFTSSEETRAILEQDKTKYPLFYKQSKF